MDEAFAGLTGYRRVIDDIVIYDSNPTQHINHVHQFLQRCAERQITFNTDKWEFAQPQVTFAGFALSAQGYSVDKSITDAISSFPTPTNRTDLRAFCGLANQLSASTAALANLLAPLRPLLSTKNEFMWSPDIEKAFCTANSHLPPPSTISTSTIPHAFVLTPAVRDSGSYCNNRTGITGPSSRLAPDFSLTRSPGMPSLSWSSSLCHGPSPNASCFSRAFLTSPSSPNTTLSYRFSTVTGWTK